MTEAVSPRSLVIVGTSDLHAYNPWRGLVMQRIRSSHGHARRSPEAGMFHAAASFLGKRSAQVRAHLATRTTVEDPPEGPATK